MEFLDEDARPRFLLQSKTLTDQSDDHPQTLSKPFLFLTLSLSSSLLALSLLFLHSEPSKSLLLWLSLSLLLGPFAPPSLTAGDVRVGRGPVLDPPASAAADDNPPPPEKKVRSRRSVETVEAPAMAEFVALGERKSGLSKDKREEKVWEERDWREEEVEVLRKQLVKHPAGKPGRWEAVAESFRGRHGVESVIRKAKELGERRPGGDEDSYSEFLKRRKPADKRLLAEQGSGGVGDGGSDLDEKAEGVWSSGEDIALLNALKAFPKEAAMRWEKVAAAVPGKSKAACVKRVAELKKGFRSSKKAGSAVAEEEG